MSTFALLKFILMLSHVWNKVSTLGCSFQSLAQSNACLPSFQTPGSLSICARIVQTYLFFFLDLYLYCKFLHSISLTWNDFLLYCIKIMHIHQSMRTNILWVFFTFLQITVSESLISWSFQLIAHSLVEELCII